MTTTTTEIPGFQNFMLPFLKVLSDGQTKHMKVITEEVIKMMGLTPEQCQVKIPSQSDTVVRGRVGWSRTYLYKAGLIHQVSRANYHITEEGRKAITEHPEGISTKYLKTLEPFQHWLNMFSEEKNDAVDQEIREDNRTPQEILDASFNTITNDVADELLQRIKACHPSFFEKLVVDVLIAMGYGGFDSSRGQVTQYSGDGGIDGIIKEDKLGLDTIYIQAKRWENTVPVSSIRDFAGSLLSKKARKGVFITTSSFPQSAYEYVGSIDPRIILIDGVQLTRMMIEYNVAVSKGRVYEIKKVDNDYFEL